MGQCTISDLKIKTALTGHKANGKPVQQVTIENFCICGQSNVIIDCTGLQSAAPLVNITKVGANKCLVNNGDIIYGFQSVSFTYAWDKAFAFKLINSQMSCS